MSACPEWEAGEIWSLRHAKLLTLEHHFQEGSRCQHSHVWKFPLRDQKGPVLMSWMLDSDVVFGLVLHSPGQYHQDRSISAVPCLKSAVPDGAEAVDSKLLLRVDVLCRRCKEPALAGRVLVAPRLAPMVLASVLELSIISTLAFSPPTILYSPPGAGN